MTPQKNADTIRPFEWLTSPSSLQQVLSTISAAAAAAAAADDDGSNEKKTKKQALHIGSGSSAVGEYLVEELSYDRVLDVDKDEGTLQRMKKRWHDKCARTGVDSSRLEHVVCDFTASRIESADDASFSLVLDKSTLDCTLCSDNATAALLVEVYRCLEAGGIYLLISFHEQDMLLPLLRDLPGADWEITSQTMARQVERLDGTHTITATNDSQSFDTKDANDTHSQQHHHHPPLNVLLARKVDRRQEGHQDQQHHLSLEDVRDHVHRVNDVWFQESHPLLTRQRQQALQASFSEPLPLPQAYQYLFTEAEREHLTYDLFLEDWQVFIEKWQQEERQRNHPSGLVIDEQVLSHQNKIICASSTAQEESSSTQLISYEMALEFLTEMQ